MKRHYPVYIIMAVLIFFCGCETMGAFGTGRITSSDVAYITHAGAIGKKTAPVNVDSPDADEMLPETDDRRAMPKPRVSNVDAWLEENLW